MGKCIIARRGLDTSDATATAADILSGKTAYVQGNKLTGSLTTFSYTVGSADLTGPSISVNVAGVVTTSNVSYTVPSGTTTVKVSLLGGVTESGKIYLYSDPDVVTLKSGGVFTFTAELQYSNTVATKLARATFNVRFNGSTVYSENTSKQLLSTPSVSRGAPMTTYLTCSHEAIY